ncbi:cell division control protein 14, SIN component-domain-containing protein [Mycena sp. CBHHK59/15]|nr:cell division control protein 14, SIN component-domain-containing protein [Mycena sp. CBHHK59/15]
MCSEIRHRRLDYFLALQYTFECNVASRILSWVAASTIQLELLTNKGVVDPELDPDVATISAQLALGLSIIQGVCLTHPATKAYLGRRYSLEVLLDLFLASRHLSKTPFTSAAAPGASPTKPAPGAPPPLASVILDALLCILVDASPALRVFEACAGVHAVVKILKRAGTPREVRMKCLEFLYFYLLDETVPAHTTPAPANTTPEPALVPTAPSTPVQPQKKKPFIGAAPARPASRYGSSTFSLTSSAFASSSLSSSPFSSASASSWSASTSFASSTSSVASSSESGSSSSRSASGGSATSFSSTSSNASSLSRPKSVSPTKRTQFLPGSATPNPKVQGSTTPRVQGSATPKVQGSATPNPKAPGVATPNPKLQRTATPRALLMLRKDVDFVPLSPKKAVVVGALGRTRSRLVGSMIAGEGEDEEQSGNQAVAEDAVKGTDNSGETVVREARTTEEKKLLLATMLGNVEALVEGVRKAGIWGLG